jgi:hypothetical protein
MTRLTLPLDDGSTLVLTGLAQEGAPEGAHTLNAADFVRDAVLAGVAGNFSYDLLKAIATQLRARTFLLTCPQPTATEINRTVTDHFTATGHAAVRILHTEQLTDESWFVEGTVDQQEFEARADPSGQVMQARIRA